MRGILNLYRLTVALPLVTSLITTIMKGEIGYLVALNHKGGILLFFAGLCT